MDWAEFTPLFEPPAGQVGGYLNLLNLHIDAESAIALIRAAIAASGSRLPERIEMLLSQPNWRPQLVGAAALFVGGEPQCLDALWSALDRPCWTSPQLAATAAHIDPDFEARAKLRIEQGCPMDWSAMLPKSMLERHSAQGPAGADGQSAKLLAVLLTLCGRREPEPVWLASLRNMPTVQALVRRDLDGSGDIALRWAARMEEPTSQQPRNMVP